METQVTSSVEPKLTETTIQKPKAEKPKTVIPNFGHGETASTVTEIFKWLCLFVSSTTANKVCLAIQRDYGDAKKQAREITNAKIGFGRTGKTGEMTLKESFKFATEAKPSLQVGRAWEYAAKAGQNHLSFSLTKWQLDEKLTKWLATLK